MPGLNDHVIPEVTYRCPHCGGRARLDPKQPAPVGGVIGYILLGGLRCKACGPVSASDFAPEERRRMVANRAAGLALFVALPCALALIVNTVIGPAANTVAVWLWLRWVLLGVALT